MNKESREPLDGRRGVWDNTHWCLQAGMTLPTKLQLKVQPRQTKIGRLVRITEAPRDYYERVRHIERANGQVSHDDESEEHDEQTI